jgi:hypothetical protein
VCKFLSFCSDGNGNYYYSDWKLRKKILKCYIDLHRKGFVPSFDGTTWRQEFNVYGGGVSSLVSTPSALFAFLRFAETGVYYDGAAWRSISISEFLKNHPLIKTILWRKLRRLPPETK